MRSPLPARGAAMSSRVGTTSVLVVMLLVAACVAPGPSTGPTTAPSPVPSGALGTTPGDASASAEAQSPAPSTPASTVPPVSDEPPPIALELVAAGLASPISIAGDPSGRLWVNERAGRVVAIEPDGTTHVVLDISDRISSGGERGLLGLALHPDWPTDRRAFVHYSDVRGDTVLASFPAAGDTASPTLDPAGERILLQVQQPFANHNGGQVAFGPDGYLYLGLGDGGSGGDPLGHGQDPTTLLGSILRLDVSVEPYAVPADNGFAAGGGAPEVHVYGLRNPWRFSFDRVTGDLWIGDVGQGDLEEIDRLRPGEASGANLGWNLMEGTRCFASPSCDSTGLVLPLAEYGHDQGCSVTGGYVYRGTALPALVGWYVFADYCSGQVFGVPSDAEPPDGSAIDPSQLLSSGLEISAFGEGADGELYVADREAGAIYRIVAG